MIEDINLLGVEEHVVQDQRMWRAVITCQPHPRWENGDVSVKLGVHDQKLPSDVGISAGMDTSCTAPHGFERITVCT